MSSVSARIWGQQQLAYVPHTSVSGEAWSLRSKGTCTGNGAADGTTLVDAGIASGGADALNGRWWVRMLSGTCQGECKRVVDDNGSGTLTLENNGFSAQIDSGDEYEIVKSPDPVVVVDSSSGETNMVDAIRAEADDYWNGYYACPITGSHRGKVAQITDFTSSTGTFVLSASFGSALAAGDVVLIRKFIEPSAVQPGPGQAYIPRPGNRVNFSMGDGVVGAKSGSFGFTLPVRGSNSLAASGSKATRAQASGLFEAVGLEESQGTSCTIQAGATTTSLPIATGTWQNLAIGQAVIVNGNVSWVTALTDGGAGDDTVTVSPPLPDAPDASDVLYATNTYKLSTDGDTLGVLLELEVDGIRTTYTGCKGNVTVQELDGMVGLAFALQADHWIRELEAAPYNPSSAYASSAPVLYSDRVAYLGTTATNIGGFTATPGTQVTAKNVQGSAGLNGRVGFHITGYQGKGATFRELLASDGNLDQDLRFTARTSSALTVVFGSHGNACGVRIPAARHVEAPHPADAGGLVDVPSVMAAHDAGTQADGGGTIQKVSDWAFFIS